MKNVFTPMPWQVTEAGVRNEGGYICLINRPTRYPGQDERHEKETAERQANARLIAAAPDLLTALTEISTRLNTCHPHIHYVSEVFDSYYTDMINAAIDKATGGEA